VVFSVAPDFGAAVIKLVGGEADFFESVRPENIAQLERNRSLRLQPYPSLDYGFLQFNLRAPGEPRRPHPVFADRELRRALTMAVDRERLVANVFDSLAYVALGPVPRALFPDAARIQQLPHDAVRARQVLDSLGWRDSDGDGWRDRGGVTLAFRALVPTSSVARQRLAVLLQEQFRVLGVRMEIEPLSIGAFEQRASARRFDALMGGWHADPSPGSIRQTWGTAGTRIPSGSNRGMYSNRAFDTAVDSALAALAPARARAHWLRAYQTIVDDAPAIWLFEPRLVAAMHRRIRAAPLRADGWWAGLAEWSVPPAERIARDRVGIR
jgi:peptide/nickel transport system substrate-binding protein